MSEILVINSGSSSLKYAVIEATTGARVTAGLVERIGEAESTVNHSSVDNLAARSFPARVCDHDQAFACVLERLAEAGLDRPAAVGHRVVHGGDHFTQPVLIDADVRSAIAACVPLAPLHNPPCLSGIDAAVTALPDVPQVAVFDTAFHTTIPEPARTYAIDREVAREHRLQRYGFHGTSHEYVGRRAADLLGIPFAECDLITLHLGNGASACAIHHGRSVETSMGVTPLEGLVMGTRSGDIDPSIPEILGRAGWSAAEVDTMLNRRSGLLGLCGDNDLREVHARAEAGDERAALARDVYAHRIRKYVGAYLIVLGGADALVFTAGVGEHDAWMRQAVCRGLDRFGISVDHELNAAGPGAAGTGSRRISPLGTPTPVLVIPTDEEQAIAEQTAGLLGLATGFTSSRRPAAPH